MPINADKPHLWKADVETSIDFYNDWFLKFAPETFRAQRQRTTAEVLSAFELTGQLLNVSPRVLEERPGILPVLRMATAPPLGRDRLMGLAYVSRSLIQAMEGDEHSQPRIPPRMSAGELAEQLNRICDVLSELMDRDLFGWLETKGEPTKPEVQRAAMVVADRLCGAASDPIIRNAQERRQLAALKRWLSRNGYCHLPVEQLTGFEALLPGQFTFRLNIPGGDPAHRVNIPVDAAIQPLWAEPGSLPLLVEAKSAGDATNTNKRRKEEAQKLSQLRRSHGNKVQFLLLLCGYFEPAYLGYVAAEGIDWIWEHRLGDLSHAVEKREEGGLSDGGVLLKDSPQPSPAGTTREELRLRLQGELDGGKSSNERNRAGQFATPLAIATDIVAKALSYLPPDVPLRMLEPACGTGAFFSASSNLVAPRRWQLRVGVDIDPDFVKVAKDLWENEGVVIVPGSFVEFSASTEYQARFNFLCTNPPYVRHHYLDSTLKASLQTRVAAELGIRVSGLAGLYVYFVLLAHAVLAEGAIASWLIPAEFLVVNYGEALRRYLAAKVTLLDLYQFDPEQVQFDDALVSSCMITYRKSRPPTGHHFDFHYGGSIVEASMTKRIEVAGLSTDAKWRFADSDGVRLHCRTDYTVGDFFDIRRGIATGANDFFVMTRSQALERGIPRDFLKPVLTSPRRVRSDVIDADSEGVPLLSEMLFLLDCPMPPEEVKRRYPKLWEYLEQGRKEGKARGYLCRNREVWYWQERRQPALFLVSYMGRSSVERESPFRFFLNRSQAIATNCFLNLYPKPRVAAAIAGQEERARTLLHLLNSVARETSVRNGRSYGGGLHKMEPSELRSLPLGDLPDWLAHEREPAQLLLV